MASDQIEVTFKVKVEIDSDTEAFMNGVAEALTELGKGLQRQGEKFKTAMEELKRDSIL